MDSVSNQLDKGLMHGHDSAFGCLLSGYVTAALQLLL